MVFYLHITIGLQIVQHRLERLAFLPPQVFQIGETDAILAPAGEAQDVVRHLALLLVEGYIEALLVVVQVSGSAGPGKPLFKALIDHCRRDVAGIASARIADRRKEKLEVVRYWIIQQVQDPGD